jgi:isopentenyl diphosphate isomerase/L-lactate dehydrogenase-like FMN-dependent dehydrogenase
MDPRASVGADAVRSVFEKMTAELNRAMAVTCSPDINRIDPSILWPKG